MEESIKNLNKVYDKFSNKYFTPEIESSFHRLGKYYGTYDFIKPFLEPVNFDGIEFYILDKYLDSFRNNYKNHKLVDENYIMLNDETVIEILKEYGKGFRESYFEFKNPLKPHTPKNIDGNRKLISKIYDIVVNKKPQPYGVIPTTFLSKNEVNISKIIQDLEDSYYNLQFYQVTKESAHLSGYNGGLFYKSWEIILENRPLFNEIFKKKSEQKNYYAIKSQKKTKPLEPIIETKIIETKDLSLKDIPNLNLQQRYNLFEQLSFDDAIHQLNTTKQTSKHKILALIMGISPDNAKHLINGSYTKLNTQQQEELEEYLQRIRVKL